MASLPIETRIFEHVVGASSPLDDLLQRGSISPKWVDTYLDLLAEAKHTWLKEPCWPRHLVAAVHMASWILDSRYRAWSGSDKSKRNSTTEDLLATVASASHIFLDTPAIEGGHLGA